MLAGQRTLLQDTEMPSQVRPSDSEDGKHMCGFVTCQASDVLNAGEAPRVGFCRELCLVN